MRLAAARVAIALLAELGVMSCVPPAATEHGPLSPPPSEPTSSESPSAVRSAPSPAPAPAPAPDDDQSTVGPPSAVDDCHEQLRGLGVEFRPAQLPLQQSLGGVFTCGANDAVVYSKGPTGLRISPPPVMSCRLAIAFVGLEKLMQELAAARLGSTVKRVQQAGTYNCRKMVRFALVSEHSYGNAIDLTTFALEDGRTISVLKHFGKLDAAPVDPRARFLRELGEQAFDRRLIAVSLGPYWDSLHRDHFHFDMARYRVDGSRPH